MKTCIRLILAAAVLMSVSRAYAGSFTTRTDYRNANLYAPIDQDSGMSFSVWTYREKRVERHGGQPIVTPYFTSGWCFFITTCPIAGGDCVTETEICGGPFSEDDLAIGNDSVTFTGGGFVFACAIDRRANSSSNKRDVAFDGSSNESHTKSRQVRGEGSLAGPEGAFEGFCYANEGSARTKTVN